MVQRREFRTTEISIPSRESVMGSPTVTRSTTIEVLIEDWNYDLGSNRLTRSLTFENGRLLNIRIGDYGVR